jgi:hypothetical protein
MKGYKFQTPHDTRKSLVDKLILKGLPYGKWTTEDNKEYLFNIDYEVIDGWDLETGSPIQVHPRAWIYGIEKEEFYFDGSCFPTRREKTLRKCWDILANWSARYDNNYTAKGDWKTWHLGNL